MFYRLTLTVFALLFSGTALAAPLDVFATPVALNPSNPHEDRIGLLRYSGGLILSSPDKRFGGLSGLLVSADGTQLGAVSDKGYLLHISLQYGADGTLRGIADADIDRLRDYDGDPLEGKRSSDAEALAQDAEGGLFVAFERRHRIDAYATAKAPARLLPPPPQFLLMSRNGGVEALTRLADGRLLALSEGFVTSNGLLGWIGTPASDGTWNWETVSYPYDGRNVPTGATLLPNGDVLVVERRYSPLEGVAMRLRRIPGEEMTPGATLRGTLLADLAQPYSVDNFEGVAVFHDPSGRLRVLLVSDDNFSTLQRTLLLSFVLLSP